VTPEQRRRLAVDLLDLPYAHEALARAHAVAGESDEAARSATRARELGAQIADAEDGSHLKEDLSTLP